MSKVAIVYWSGTGNTEAMAKAIEEGAKAAGADVSLLEVESFRASTTPEYDGLLFGCPAMGDEVLEEGSFEPVFTDAEKHLSGKPVALFGSYGWGGGAWMES
ncbi:MAG: flavodoxin domain-containing protein, partial [Selenomonas sp.]|nr:flavodoxin domain-containing protein [Selenomonas sp.]